MKIAMAMTGKMTTMTSTTNRTRNRSNRTDTTVVKLLISAVALAATVSGWGALAGADVQTSGQAAAERLEAGGSGEPFVPADVRLSAQFAPIGSGSLRRVSAPRVVTKERAPVAITRSSR